MKITNISIKGFKAINELGIQDPAQVNYLVGPNGSGKSSIFEALSLPCLLIRSGNTGPVGIDFYGDLQRTIRADFVLKITMSDGNNTLENTITMRAPDHRTFRIDPTDFTRMQGGDFSQGVHTQNWLASVLDINATSEEENSGVKSGYSFNLDNATDGEAIKRFLNSHYAKESEHVRNVVRSITDSRAIEIEITSADNHAESVRFEALKTMSFGYQQLLGLYFILREKIREHVRNAGSTRVPIVCIEEPGLGLHPGLQKKLPEIFNDILQEEEFQEVVIFVTTHSPFIINAASNYGNQKVYLINNGNSVNKAGKKTIPSSGYSKKQGIDVAAKMLGAGFEDIGVSPAIKEAATLVYCEGSSETRKDSEIYNELFADEQARYIFISAGNFTEAIYAHFAARTATKFVFGEESSCLVLVDRSYSHKDKTSISIGDITLGVTSSTKPMFTESERDDFLKTNLECNRMLKRKEIENYLFDPKIVSLLSAEKRDVFSEEKLISHGVAVSEIKYIDGEVKDLLKPSSEKLMVELARLTREHRNDVAKDIYGELLNCLTIAT